MLDEPFVSAKVEQQVEDLKEELQSNQYQEVTRNLSLLQDLHRLSQVQSYQTDPDVLNRVRSRILQRLDAIEVQRSQLHTIGGAIKQKKEKGLTQQKRKRGYLGLLVAALIISILSLSTIFFVFPLLHRSSSSQGSVSQTPAQHVGALNTLDDPELISYQHDLYVNAGENIQSYAAENGVFKQAYTLPGTGETTLVGDPTIVNGILYMSVKSSTSALRLSDHKVLWQAPFGNNDDNDKPPILVNGALYIITNTVLTVLRVSDGTLLWQYHVVNQGESLNSFVVVGRGVYITSSNSSMNTYLYALHAQDGTLMWNQTYKLNSTLYLVTDGSALYTYMDGSVVALRPGDGNVLWQRHILSPAQLAGNENAVLLVVTHNIVYLLAPDGVIYALQTLQGKILWSYKQSLGTIFSSLQVEGNTLYFGMFHTSLQYSYSFLVALQTDNGHQLWQRQLGGQQILSPLVENRVLYVIARADDNHAYLYALRASDGVQLWQHQLSFS